MAQQASLAGKSGQAPPGPAWSPTPSHNLAERTGYLHIDRDWRITFARLEGGESHERTGPDLVGHDLWALYPDLRGSPFEEHYRATMQDRQPRVFEAVYAPAGIRLQNRLYPAGDGIALFYEDITRRRQLDAQLDRRRRQQDAVARLGQAALGGMDVAHLMDRAVAETADALDVEFAKFVEPAEDGKLLLRAGVGWQPGVVGHASLSAETGSQAAYAIQAHGPILVTDLATETRFTSPALFVQHGIVSGLSVLVGPRDAPIGVLGAHSRERRQYLQDDVNFLQAIANLLAAAITRAGIEEELRRHRDDLEGLVQERTLRLEASNKEMEAFSYSVSHDLRAPLRAIDGFSNILVSHYGKDLPQEAQDMLAKVQGSAQRMGQLIESLLGLSRLGRKDLVLTRVDLGALAAQALATLSAGSPDRRVLTLVQPNLWATGDADLLRVVIDNLVDNAWKFTAKRSRARIEVGRVADASEPTFFVRDNGAGFDMEHAGNLFKPFQRLHSPAEFEGSGVGLATIQRIVARHGGRAWAEGTPTKGATFWFTLPDNEP